MVMLHHAHSVLLLPPLVSLALLGTALGLGTRPLPVGEAQHSPLRAENLSTAALAVGACAASLMALQRVLGLGLTLPW